MASAIKTLIIPDLGEGASEGTIAAILVTPGSVVEAGQSLIEVETDKVTLEVPAECAGRILEMAVAVGQTVASGTLFARIDVLDASGIALSLMPSLEPAPARVPQSTEARVDISPQPQSAMPAPEPQAPPPERATALADGGAASLTVPAGPSARREARELGVDLALVQGSGPGQRISRDDVRRYVKERIQRGEIARPAAEPLPDLAAFGPVHSVPLPRIAQTTARNMARSARLVPHAWIQTTADVTALETARRDLRRLQVEGDPPVTLSVLIVRAVAKALLAYPRFNAAFDAENQAVVVRDYVNVGLAVATGRGLVVPVARDPLGMDLMRLAKELDALVRGARDDKLPLRAYQGAGFTISNLGGHGVQTLQPLVNWPEVAILGVGALVETPRVVNDQIAIRRCMSLTVGFDHRVINGADAAAFLGALVAELENPLRLALSPPGSSNRAA